jgi:phosphohistidine phosphatase SixA
MRTLIQLTLLFTICVSHARAEDQADVFTLYLVRHAEKVQDGSRDPLLDQAGTERAAQLSNWLQGKSIEDVWSSDYQRTRHTAKPLLLALGKELLIYDPRQLAELTQQLLERKNNALVVGHSNTTPELARLLCACEIEPMEESEYSRLIVIKIAGDQVVASALNQSELFNQDR